MTGTEGDSSADAESRRDSIHSSDSGAPSDPSDSIGPRSERAEGAETGSYDRRRYLQLVGTAGVLSVGSIPTAAGASQDDENGDGTGGGDADADWIVDVPDEDDWEDAADERIREYRTAELTVEVTTPDGEPIPDADVRVEQVAHEYGFGTAVNAETLFDESADGDEYRERIPELFNTAVMENRHKWRFFEEQRELADEATDWLLERGLDLRGHACLWANRDAYAVPADVEDALDEDDAEFVRERTFEHLETIITHYGDDIVEWDVVNEAIHEPEFATVIDGSNVSSVEAPVLAEWYLAAEEVAPDGVSLAVNDYNVLAGPESSTRNLYDRQIEFLLEEGVDLGGIGLQSHFRSSSQLDPIQTLEALNRYAEHGVPIRITEFDAADPGWDDEEKGDFLRGFLKTVFSHPATDDFVMWGFWDERHWRDDAPLFYDDWDPKPAYDVYTELVFDEWWTDEEGTTDDDGRYAVTGFRGEYELTASRDGEEETTTVTLTEGGETVEIALDVEVESESVPGFGAATGLAGLAGGAAYALSRRTDRRQARRTADSENPPARDDDLE